MVTHDSSTGASVRYGDTDGEDVGDSDATVWIAPRSQTRAKHGCYHTDSDCPHIDPDRFHEVSRERALGRYDLRECEHCAGTATHAGAGPSDHYRALKAAAAANAERDDDRDERR